MPSNRHDDDMPKITLDREDREAFRQSRSKSKYSGSTEPEVSSATSTTTSSGTGSGASPVWTSILLVLIFAGLGASFWLYQQQVKHVQMLESAQQRIADLENQLSATGEEMGESAVALQAKVGQLDTKTKELWDQMDRLWASAWRRNQSDIKKLGARLDGMDTSSEGFEKQFNLLQADVTASITNLGLLQEQIDQQVAQLKTTNTNLSDVTNTVALRYKKIQELERKLTATDKISSQLLKRLKDLEKWREEAVKANKAKPDPEVMPKTKKDLPPPLTVG